MAWPSTKAITTNVDAGSDSPSSARADIKQNIDNVNSIIDEFDIASPNNGDILTYNSTSGAWEPGAAASTGTNVALITRTSSSEENVSSNIYRLGYTESDPNSFITAVDSFQIQLAAGSYLFDCFQQETDQTATSLGLYNETGATELTTFNYNEIGSTGEGFRQGKTLETFTGTTNISFKVDEVDINKRNGTQFSITVIKL